MSKRKEGESFSTYKERLKLEQAHLNSYLKGRWIHVSIEGDRVIKDEFGILHRRYGKTYHKEKE